MMRLLHLDANPEGLPRETTLQPDGDLRRPAAGELLWLDISAQTAPELQMLGRVFGFHPLALEDCLHFDQRPKIEEYPGPDPYLFVVIHHFYKREADATLAATATATEDGGTLLRPEAALVAQEQGAFVIEPQEIHAFLGRGFLVTIHEAGCTPLEGVWRRVAGEAVLLRRGADFVYYLLADALCDSNFPVLEDLSDVLDGIEEAVLSRPQSKHLHRIYQLRKALVNMRRVLSPQRDILALLSRHGGDLSGAIQPATTPYFRDVYDHLVRINEGIESGRDLLGNCVDAYLSAVGQRTNEIMKQLTILSCIMLPLTFITGFFGMNFEMLPVRSGWALGATLVLMFLVLPAAMLGWFRHKGWL